MTVYHWLNREGVIGFTLAGWFTATPPALWAYFVTKRRHQEKLAAIRESR